MECSQKDYTRSSKALRSGYQRTEHGNWPTSENGCANSRTRAYDALVTHPLYKKRNNAEKEVASDFLMEACNDHHEEMLMRRVAGYVPNTDKLRVFVPRAEKETVYLSLPKR